MTAVGTRKLTLEIDGVPYTAQVSNVRITSAEAEDEGLTFEEAAGGGGRDYALAITLTQDMAEGTLWTEIFDNAGTDVPYSVAPYGNATPTASQPHFEGICTLTEPSGDLLGGEANRSNKARMRIDVEFPCTAKPTKVKA